MLLFRTVFFNQGSMEPKGSVRDSQGIRQWPVKYIKITAKIAMDQVWKYLHQRVAI